MADAGSPVSELEPLGGAVFLESTLPGQSLFDASKSSSQAITTSRLAGGSGNIFQEEPKEAISEICKVQLATSTKETNCSSLRLSQGPQSQCEHCVPQNACYHPHRLAEIYTPAHYHQTLMNVISDTPQAARTVQSIKSASLPVHMSHSDTLPLLKQEVIPQALVNETCGLAYHGGEKSVQEAESHSMLAYKQPMQLEQCNIIATICRGATSGDSGVQQPQKSCVYVSSPKAAAKVEGMEEKGHLFHKCDNALGSYNHHVNFEDTFEAYCHPQPIPAPSQLLPRPAGVEPIFDIQHTVAPPSPSNHLTLPRLISSVSETGLDAKHLLRCCNLNCSWISLLPPGIGSQSQKHLGGEECCSYPFGNVRTITQDMGTMTCHKELRDVGVQTGQIVTPHVFPQICLAEESRKETSSTPSTDRYGGKKPGGAPKSPVKEVKWDAEGMTWEVYGASVDPEELGLAIQKHLELQIKETASHAAKVSQQNTNTSGKNTGCHRKKSRVMGSIRNPACCARSTTAID